MPRSTTSATPAGQPAQPRPRLTRDAVLTAAVRIADTSGLAALTMRSLAESLGVKPMSLYHHVAHKDAILDGLVDVVMAEIDLPTPGEDWRAELTRRAHSARAALAAHPWAVGLLESRTSPGPATLRQHDAMLGTLRTAGFSLPMTAHAYALLDAYVFGFAVQESSLPATGPDDVPQVAARMAQALDPATYPHLTEFATQHVMRPGYDFADEFDYGLQLILDGLQERRTG